MCQLLECLLLAGTPERSGLYVPSRRPSYQSCSVAMSLPSRRVRFVPPLKATQLGFVTLGAESILVSLPSLGLAHCPVGSLWPHGAP